MRKLSALKGSSRPTWRLPESLYAPSKEVSAQDQASKSLNIESMDNIITPLKNELSVDKYVDEKVV